jgi:hypothetical protein
MDVDNSPKETTEVTDVRHGVQNAAIPVTKAVGSTSFTYTTPYVDLEDSNRRLFDKYQTITAHYKFREYSLEELRLADYINGASTKPNKPISPLFAERSAIRHKEVFHQEYRLVGRARVKL